MVSKTIVSTVKHGGYVMVWGCFAREFTDTVGNLFKIVGNACVQAFDC